MKRYNYSQCRSRVPGHDWVDYAGSDWKAPWGHGEEERCDRCGMIRRCIIDIRGVKSDWMYDEKPPDYGTDLTMDELRLMSVRERNPGVRFKPEPVNVTPLRQRRTVA